MREARLSIVNTGRPGVIEDGQDSLSRAKQRIERVGRDRPDLILLPETFANSAKDAPSALESAQEIPGPISEELAVLAKRYETFIAFGLLRRFGEQRFNSLALLDRTGALAWTYDKIAPVDWGCCATAARRPSS